MKEVLSRNLIVDFIIKKFQKTKNPTHKFIYEDIKLPINNS